MSVRKVFACVYSYPLDYKSCDEKVEFIDEFSSTASLCVSVLL